jgi:predicted helicase
MPNRPAQHKMKFLSYSDQRLGIFLTNTLEEAAKKSDKLFASWVADEANAAARIKRDLPIMVVTGNPPYSSSVCESEWIMSLINDYKKELKEKKTDLNREEWKFLRFAQWRIERSGYGIIGFVINNSFLDAITHRRMRECLINAFNEIYILDLHGSVLGKKTPPLGILDQNVFDIEQGVTIAIFIKENKKEKPALVWHSDLWGSREIKHDYLYSNDISTTDWKSVSPVESEYFFIPHGGKHQSEYEANWKLSQVFSKYSSGIQTKKDNLTIQYDSGTMLKVIQDFAQQSPEISREIFELGEDTSGWSVEKALLDIKKTGVHPTNIVPILYRPFDIRFTYYTGKSSGFHGRPRREIMQHMIAGSNLGLIWSDPNSV